MGTGVFVAVTVPADKVEEFLKVRTVAGWSALALAFQSRWFGNSTTLVGAVALTGDGARDGAELLTCSGLDALQVMEADVKGSRAEKGCQRFDLLDLGDNKFSFYEVYEDADAMAHHKTLPHYKGCAQLIAQLGSGVAGPVSPHLLHAPARGGLQGCQHGHRGGLTDCGQVCDCWALPVIKKVGEQRAADRGRTGTVWSAAKAHKMRSAQVGLALSAHGGARPLRGVCVPRSCISTRGRAVNAARVGRRVPTPVLSTHSFFYFRVGLTHIGT